MAPSVFKIKFFSSYFSLKQRISAVPQIKGVFIQIRDLFGKVITINLNRLINLGGISKSNIKVLSNNNHCKESIFFNCVLKRIYIQSHHIYEQYFIHSGKIGLHMKLDFFVIIIKDNVICSTSSLRTLY